jgi:acetate---CoA ligase (ADP-forming)
MNDEERRVFDALFAPRSIALVGASTDERKHTSRPQRTLRRHGYSGRVIPINPRAAEVFGDRAYPSLLDAPGDIDHAFIMVPADAVMESVRQCVERGVPVATIYTDGFAESGDDGRRRQDELVELARSGGVRLLGPNCSGIFSSRPSCAMSVNAIIEQLDVRPGSLSLISQSGSMTGGLVSRGLERGVGFARVVSIGNESDLTVGELTDWLVEDDETGAILLFLESLRDATRLRTAASHALRAGKPVIAYKLGRSAVGQQLAASHTGALAGSDDVADAFFRAAGILRVSNIEALFELPALVSGQRPATRHRVSIMSTTGGGAATVADGLGVVGVELVGPTPDVVDRVADRGIHITTATLTDLTHAGTKASVYGAVAEELLASDHSDLVVAVAGSSAQFQPEITVGQLLAVHRHGKPLAVFLAPHAAEALQQLTAAGLAGFRTPESCVEAIRAWTAWTEPLPADAERTVAGHEVVRAALGQAIGRLNEYTAGQVFAALGIPVARTQVIRDPSEPVGLTYPVVAKVLSADIPHKTDAGGVALDLRDGPALETAARNILRDVGSSFLLAHIEGILVQEMVAGLAEVIVGFRRDAEVGPIVMLGMGGVLAEVYQDVAVRLAPVDHAVANDMVDEVHGLAVIRGFRGMPLGDREALVAAVVAVSQLAYIDEVADAEINPLIVRSAGHGVVAVDGLIVPMSGVEND